MTPTTLRQRRADHYRLRATLRPTPGALVPREEAELGASSQEACLARMTADQVARIHSWNVGTDGTVYPGLAPKGAKPSPAATEASCGLDPFAGWS